MPLNILIVGAGIGGPALASFLQRSNSKHNITVVERSSKLRLAGQQIDIKAQGVPILEKMGILDAIKAQCVAETGLEMVDTNDKAIAKFGITPANKKGFTLTSEYEIMRGDMVKVLYEHSLEERSKAERRGEREGRLRYEFGKSITGLENSDDGARVTFSDGHQSQYDLVVAADGQGSGTRRLAFGADASNEAFKSIGVHAAYYSIPRLESEGGLARGYFTHRRFLVTRTSNRPVTGVYLFTMKDAENLKQSYKESIEKQKEIWAENIRDAGWQSDRFIAGLKTCDDFFAHEQGQVKMKQLYTGRVVLLGDAGYCPSPFTGLGTTSALVGAYVLAGELARQNNDVMGALKAYEKIVRVPVEEFQQLPMNVEAIFPSSTLGLWILKGIMRTVYTFGIDKLMTKFMNDDKRKGRWELPEYPELRSTE